MGQHTDRAVTNPEKYMTDTKHTDSVEAVEEIARSLSQSIRYSCGKGQYDAQSDCQSAYLNGVETAIAMMYIDLTGGHKSKGILGKLFATHQQQVEEAVREATKVATIEAWNDAIQLSDQLEESNTKFDEWRAFKGFRNGLRDRIRALVETPNHQD